MIVALVVGAAIWSNIATNRLLDDATSGVPERQKAALMRLAQREDYFDLIQSRKPPARLRVAEGVERLGNATAVKIGLAMLKDPKPEVRDRFLQALIRIGKPNVEAFIAGLKDGDPNVKAGTVKAMVAIGLDSLPVALAAINDNDARGTAGNVLIKFGSASVPGLIKILNETQDEGIRLFVIETLGKIGDRRAAPLIRPYLNLPPEKRRLVISALGIIADPGTEPDLRRTLNNPMEDSDARVQAALGLGKIATPTSVAALVKALKDMDLKVRLATVAGLQRAGTKALPALSSAMRDPDANTRRLVAQALGGIRSRESVMLLAAALRDKEIRVQRMAAVALGETGRPEAVPILIGALAARDGGVMMAASDSLAQLGPLAQDALLKTLETPDETTAYYAARALSKIGKPALKPLMAVAQLPRTRRRALVALAEMRAREAKPLFENARRSNDPILRQIAEQALRALEQP